MKKYSTILLVLIFSINAFSNWVEIPENTDKDPFGHKNISEAKTEIKFTLNGYEMNSVDEKDHKINEMILIK